MKPLWQPGEVHIRNSQLTAFQCYLAENFDISFANYEELHDWSIANPEHFWGSIWAYFEVIADQPGEQTVANLDQFPGTTWFPGSRLNFARNLLRYTDDQIALIGLLEDGQRKSLTYRELYEQVERLASHLRADGIVAGDRIAGFMPNIPETVVAMLAATSIGAIWSSCSPDFGVSAACDRLGQIEPRILFTCDAYLYNGKTISCLEKIAEIQRNIESLERTIVVPLIDSQPELSSLSDTERLDLYTANTEVKPLTFEPLPFDHPVYILYSSGTTGVPKCIVHGAGGTLLQHLKEHRLHTDISRDDTLFYFTTCGWMMWNWLVSGLASGCTLVLYDGSPFANNGKVLLDAIDDEGITVFGTSAKYISALEKQGTVPRETHNLQSVKTILSTGSPLGETSYHYIYRDFKTDVCLASITGGTDIVSCFALGNPNLPVHAGEIQCIGLGMAASFNGTDGSAEGELVCTKPFPSVPIGFWNDHDGSRFRAAYFEDNPGIWTHGDRGEITPRGGVIIHGRSDTVLNPSGVRIGTAEIYRQVEKVDGIVDSVVVGQTWEDDERVVLFVVLQLGTDLSASLVAEIKKMIRENTTPRHVPAKIIAIPDIPKTISGKIVELAVRKTIHGEPVENTDALANPETLRYFENLAGLKT